MNQPLDLDAIATAITAYQQHAPTGFACCSAHPAADVAAALVAEVRRLRAELATSHSETMREAADIVHKTIAPADWSADSVSCWNTALNIAEHRLRRHVTQPFPARPVVPAAHEEQQQ